MPKSTAEIAQGTRLYSKAAKDFTEAQLLCRSMRHNWNKSNGLRVIQPTMKGNLPYITIVWTCTRECGVQRHDRMYVKQNRVKGTFTVVERETGHYVYPEGYQIPGVPRGVKPSTILWQEFVRRNNQEIAAAMAGERETSD